MRLVGTVLIAILLSACADPTASVPSPTGAPSPAASLDGDPLDGHPLSELLPLTLSGVATVKRDIPVTNRSSPRIFLKALGRVHKKPTDTEVALAFAAGSTLYAVRIDGVSGPDYLQAYLDERTTPPSPIISIGGKQVTRIGNLAGAFLYGSDDIFFYVECPDEATAVEVLQQLP